MRHFDDKALGSLLAGELTEVQIRTFGTHVRECAACARRFEGWRSLFPQVEQLLDSSAVLPVVSLPGGPTLILPDREGQARLRFRIRRVKWVAAVGAVLAIGVLVADHREGLLQRIPYFEGLGGGLDPVVERSGATLPDSFYSVPPRTPPLSDSAPPDSSAPSLADPRPDTTRLAPLGAAEADRIAHSASKRAPSPDSANSQSAISRAGPESERTPPRAETAAAGPAEPRDSLSSSIPTFETVSRSTATLRLRGILRELPNLEQLSLEAGPGSLVSGARPDLGVVRIRYRGQDSTVVTLEEQPLSKGQAHASGELDISTTADGQRVARWIDPNGVWLQLRIWGDEQRLLELANALR